VQNGKGKKNIKGCGEGVSLNAVSDGDGFYRGKAGKKGGVSPYRKNMRGGGKPQLNFSLLFMKKKIRRSGESEGTNRIPKALQSKCQTPTRGKTIDRKGVAEETEMIKRGRAKESEKPAGRRLKD